jgi:galactokinase
MVSAGANVDPLTADQRADALVERLSAFVSQPHALPVEEVRLVRAPGRVNLIGEHTDYNLGYVLPVAIDLDAWMCSVASDDGMVRLMSVQEGPAEFALSTPGAPTGTWQDYVAGITRSLAQSGVEVRAVSAVVDSTVPAGAGLSSSAALELAAAWTISQSAPVPMSGTDLARAAQRAENEYVGVRSGLMDQFAAVHGIRGSALLLDCRSLEYRKVELPRGLTLVALDSRNPHRLGTSEYNVRREQCERGVAQIRATNPGVASLRDVTPEMLRTASPRLDDVVARRCEHVVHENERVMATVEALEEADLDEVGRLFAESHASLRDLFEVSSVELDALVEIAKSVRGVVGARMTGGGFGGCTVNLVHDDAVEELRSTVAREYPRRAGREAGFHVVQSADGAGLVDL